MIFKNERYLKSHFEINILYTAEQYIRKWDEPELGLK